MKKQYDLSKLKSRKNPFSDNFKKLDNMKDSEINFDNIPELDDEFFKNAQIKLPKK